VGLPSEKPETFSDKLKMRIKRRSNRLAVQPGTPDFMNVKKCLSRKSLWTATETLWHPNGITRRVRRSSKVARISKFSSET
jgi:hypothetical protein